jgi:hypothetical protein
LIPLEGALELYVTSGLEIRFQGHRANEDTPPSGHDGIEMVIRSPSASSNGPRQIMKEAYIQGEVVR